ILLSAFQGVSAQFDEEHGGLGGAPKFPQPMIWEFVLRFARRSDNPYARRMVHTTLVKMARGGMYDQLGGGFARYSVDPLWLVPHAVRGAGTPREAGPRRQGAGGVERAHGACVRGGGTRARPRRLPRSRAAQRGVRAGQHARERPPAAHVEGGPGQAQGLPRG